MAPLVRASWRREESPGGPGKTLSAAKHGKNPQVGTREDPASAITPVPAGGQGVAGLPVTPPANSTPPGGTTPAPGAGGTTPPTTGTTTPGTGNDTPETPPGPKSPDSPGGNSPTLPTPANPTPSTPQPTPVSSPSSPIPIGGTTPQSDNTPSGSSGTPATGNTTPANTQPQSQSQPQTQPQGHTNGGGGQVKPGSVNNSQASSPADTGGTLVNTGGGTIAGTIDGQSVAAAAAPDSPNASNPAPTPVKDHVAGVGASPTPVTFTAVHTSTIVFSDAAGSPISTSMSTYTSVETTLSTPQVQVQSNSSKGHGGAIAGGIIGAILFLLIATFVGIKLIRRRRQKELDMDFLTVNNIQESPPMLQLRDTFFAPRKPVPSDASLLSIPSVSDDPFWAPLGVPKTSDHGHGEGGSSSAVYDDPFRGEHEPAENPFADPSGPAPQIRVHAPQLDTFQGVGTAYGVGGQGVNRLSDGSVGKKPLFGFAV